MTTGRHRTSITVYTCTECEQRYFAEQWCHDCNRQCQRVGIGGLCPHCDEPVTIDDLLDQHPSTTVTMTTPDIKIRENPVSTGPGATHSSYFRWG